MSVMRLQSWRTESARTLWPHLKQCALSRWAFLHPELGACAPCHTLHPKYLVRLPKITLQRHAAQAHCSILLMCFLGSEHHSRMSLGLPPHGWASDSDRLGFQLWSTQYCGVQGPEANLSTLILMLKDRNYRTSSFNIPSPFLVWYSLYTLHLFLILWSLLYTSFL